MHEAIMAEYQSQRGKKENEYEFSALKLLVRGPCGPVKKREDFVLTVETVGIKIG